MNPDQILVEQLKKMLENDTSQLEKIVSEIVKDLDKKKLGEAYYIIQKIQMEIYKLVSLIS